MLKLRSTVAEELDDLELSGDALEKVLNDLSRINKYLGNTRSTIKELKKTIRAHQGEELHIVDIGCGGGDNLIAIGEYCQLRKIPHRLTGIDGNVNVLDYARSRSDLPIEFIQADLLDADFVLPKCDVLMSSHFMYHFSDNDLIKFLNKSKESVSKLMLFSELRRSVTAYILFRLGGFVLPISKMAKKDGLTAIKRAFKKEELGSILSQSNPSSFTIKRVRFFRLIIRLAYDVRKGTT